MHHVDSQITPGCVQLKDLQLDNDVHLLVSAPDHHNAILMVCTLGDNSMLIDLPIKLHSGSAKVHIPC